MSPSCWSLLNHHYSMVIADQACSNPFASLSLLFFVLLSASLNSVLPDGSWAPSAGALFLAPFRYRPGSSGAFRFPLRSVCPWALDRIQTTSCFDCWCCEWCSPRHWVWLTTNTSAGCWSRSLKVDGHHSSAISSSCLQHASSTSLIELDRTLSSSLKHRGFLYRSYDLCSDLNCFGHSVLLIEFSGGFGSHYCFCFCSLPLNPILRSLTPSWYVVDSRSLLPPVPQLQALQLAFGYCWRTWRSCWESYQHLRHVLPLPWIAHPDFW